VTIFFTPTQNFEKDLFKALSKYCIRSIDDLERALNYDYSFDFLPETIKNPYKFMFSKEKAFFFYEDFIGSSLIVNNPPLGYRHIKLHPNAPKFQFLSGWFGGNGHLYVLGIIYLDETGIPRLYFPTMGNPTNTLRSGRAYFNTETYPKDNNGSFLYNFDEMRNDIIIKFDLDREDWR